MPSAREFLPQMMDAMRDGVKVSFTYAGFNRSRAEKDIVLHPYVLKRYKQRWYVLGLKESADDVRTYALDRIKSLRLLPEHFTLPEGCEASDFFGSVVGVTTSKAPVHRVRLRATARQAKYLRALPLHASQQEEVHGDYSIFSYGLQLNYELVHEIVGMGDSVKVLDPPELRVMVTEALRAALRQYEGENLKNDE